MLLRLTASNLLSDFNHDTFTTEYFQIKHINKSEEKIQVQTTLASPAAYPYCHVAVQTNRREPSQPARQIPCLIVDTQTVTWKIKLRRRTGGTELSGDCWGGIGATYLLSAYVYRYPGGGTDSLGARVSGGAWSSASTISLGFFRRHRHFARVCVYCLG